MWRNSVHAAPTSNLSASARLLATGLLALAGYLGQARAAQTESAAAEPPEPRMIVPTPCPDAEQLAKFMTTVSKIEADISTGDKMTPSSCASNLFHGRSDSYHARHEALNTFHWVAPNLGHQPLYFDDVPLERYGQARHRLVQPFLSGGRFFLSVPTVPYKMAVDRPFSCVTSLGKYRPGSPTPCTCQLPPWSWKGAALEGSTIVALILLLP